MKPASDASGRARFFIANCSGDTFTSDRSGAIAIHTWQVARAAAKDAYQPVVLTRQAAGQPLTLPNVREVRWPAPRTRVTRRLRNAAYEIGGTLLPSSHEIFAARLVRQIKRYPQPHTILFGNDPEVLVHVRERLPEARLVHIFHNLHPADEDMRRRLVESADAIAAVSRFTARECSRAYNTNIGVVYNGVDAEVFRSARRSTSPSGPLIGFTGTFSPEKGLDLLLDALIQLRHQGESFRLRLVGDYYWGMSGVHEYATAVDRQIDELRNAGVTVETLGRLSRDVVAQQTREVDIAVVPSRVEEAFGLVLAEAMSSGCAVIAARAGGMPELLDDGGLYFERGDCQSLAVQLRRLLKDPTLRDRLGRTAVTRVKRFTWDATWSQLKPYLFGELAPERSLIGTPAS